MEDHFEKFKEHVDKLTDEELKIELESYGVEFEEIKFYDREIWLTKDIKNFRFDLYMSPGLFGIGFFIDLGQKIHMMTLDIGFIRFCILYYKNREILF